MRAATSSANPTRTVSSGLLLFLMSVPSCRSLLQTFHGVKTYGQQWMGSFVSSKMGARSLDEPARCQ
ncbi:hypothetical protein J6590_054679 [Homalodisca vitripennis]|nr:hypothetical protein J6590_054679 [Homalodisca vitripennis]